MVLALNNYLETYRAFQLNSFTNSSPYFMCQAPDVMPSTEQLRLFTLPNAEPSVANMRQQQMADLNVVFQWVDGLPHTIDDYFEDIGMTMMNGTFAVTHTNGGN